jgi:hypothetical protein
VEVIEMKFAELDKIVDEAHNEMLGDFAQHLLSA